MKTDTTPATGTSHGTWVALLIWFYESCLTAWCRFRMDAWEHRLHKAYSKRSYWWHRWRGARQHAVQHAKPNHTKHESRTGCCETADDCEADETRGQTCR